MDMPTYVEEHEEKWREWSQKNNKTRERRQQSRHWRQRWELQKLCGRGRDEIRTGL